MYFYCAQVKKVKIQLPSTAHIWTWSCSQVWINRVQVKQVKIQLPSSAKKDGIAMEKQLLNFQHLLEEGSDAEAAYLAEQLLVAQIRYLIQM